MSEPLVTRAAALRSLRGDRTRLLAALDRLLRSVLATPGLGGGAWSPKDLLGHLESCEEDALGALEAWSRGQTAPIDRPFALAG